MRFETDDDKRETLGPVLRAIESDPRQRRIDDYGEELCQRFYADETRAYGEHCSLDVL